MGLYCFYSYLVVLALLLCLQVVVFKSVRLGNKVLDLFVHLFDAPHFGLVLQLFVLDFEHFVLLDNILSGGLKLCELQFQYVDFAHLFRGVLFAENSRASGRARTDFSTFGGGKLLTVAR